ncbi:putative enoyl-CoA hydratase [Nocardia nova SH22a]|uniref:Putative enoyl-CoA hydratase n=1 Tax=Nocardia nova SH22a TaxID=1415166 RepID=W5TLI8_9NOCA|nr:crotonase/enoyl-CoA hydratase family protein [Nocardia nova]AHH19999.1 putative enoyl-CoA hydratase [Nocardia nova SH22a]
MSPDNESIYPPTELGEATHEAIRTEVVEKHILIITIDRPERRNAFDGATARAMETTIDEFEADDSLRVAILTGSDVVFSAGQDLIAAAGGDMATTERRGGFGIMAQPPAKPLIAAVEGHALAGGLELCLACDLIVSSRTASMGLPEAARSLVAVGGGCFRLPKRIPYHLAMELILTGKPWPATHFADLGLVNRLTEPGHALAGALELARAIVAAGPLAVRASKQIAMHAHDWTDDEAWRKQWEYASAITDSEDLREGLRAFAEKRTPVWKGR